MALEIKICGLSTEATLDAALEAGADMVGFVFFPASPRHITPNRAAELRKRVGGRAAVVALTVNAEDSDLDEIVERVAPDWLQFHGSESAARIEVVRSRHSGVRAMKAVGVRGVGDIPEADAFLGVVDRVLFDAKPPIGAMLPGGNGVAFNWRLLRGLALDTPFMVSGGLDAGCVREALELTGAAGVDVSSGVETAPGRKDPDLIRGFVAAARLAEAMRPRRPANPSGIEAGAG